MNETPIRLSPAGEVRRETMLDGLLDEMRSLHCARRRRRRVVVATGAGLAMVLVSVVAWRVMQPPPASTVAPRLAGAPTTSSPVMDVRRVATETGILDRYRPAATFTAEIIDDATLLATLEEIDRPAGIKGGDIPQEVKDLLS